ncbi:MAG: hypothetical protein ACI4RF_01835 [Eubacterium sp.]
MNNDIVSKLSKFAMVMSILGVCTLGICPAFGIMGIAVGLVFKNKGVQLNSECERRIRISNILGAIALVLFAIDIILAYVFLV